VPSHFPSRYPQIRLEPVQNCGEDGVATHVGDPPVTAPKLHEGEECAVPVARGSVMMILGGGRMTERMILPDFQPKLRL